jgi:surface polysaccharide O-acyltransferase-like enzyme
LVGQLLQSERRAFCHRGQANERLTLLTNTLDYPKDRDASFDALRGIAIIAVVAMHAIPWQEYQDYVILSYRQLLNFAVPVFLFISGYWSTKKPISSLEDYKQFLIKRFLRVLIPYLFWSVIYLAYEDIKTHSFDIEKTLFAILTGKASGHFYFIILIIQLYVLTPLLQYTNRRQFGIELVFLLNMIYLLVQYLMCLHGLWNFTDPLGIVHIPFHVLFLSMVVFYQAGLLMRSHYNEVSIPRIMRSVVLPAILISAVISVQEALMILTHYGNWLLAISPLKYSSFLYFACVIWGFLALRERFKNWPKLLVTIGEYSFGIFLIHMIILRGIAKVLHKVALNWSSQLLYQSIVILMTLSICLVLIYLTRRFLPKPLYSKVLGF